MTIPNTTKTARAKATVASQTAYVRFKADSGDMSLKRGEAWCTNPHVDDYYTAGLYAPDDTLVAKLHDEDVTGFQSCGMYSYNGEPVRLENLVSLTNIPQGVYIKVVLHKGDAAASELFVNIVWGR